MHTHGSFRPCHFRCGMNEGICILNNRDGVNELFTDGLIGCTQVIFHNARASFCCHIDTTARHPVDYVLGALRRFTEAHGAVLAAHVITGGGHSAGDRIADRLGSTIGRAGIPITRVRNTGGQTINLASRGTRATPTGWNVNSDAVSGYLTGRDLVDFRYIDRGAAGEPHEGDYYELCTECG